MVRARNPPYVDFSLFGKDNKRFIRRLMYSGFVLSASGEWTKQELPGPCSFAEWWKCWMVLKTTLLLLDICLPEPLDLYGELIRGMATRSDAWFIVAQADNLMRQEEFPRILRRIDLRGETTGERPWDAVFRAAVNIGEPETHAFWNTEVHNRITAWDIAGLRRSVLDRPGPGTGAGPGPGPGPRPNNKRKRNETRNAANQGNPYAGAAPDVCRNWNKGTCSTPCRHGRLHKCSLCGANHPATQCRKGHNNDRTVLAIADQEGPPKPPPPPRQEKGKGRGKGKGKG